MGEEREKVRCRHCELVQWRDRANCRRCGTALPEPVVKIVERVVEKVVISYDPAQIPKGVPFPTMAEVERAMILAAYQKSNRRPLEAARLLGIGKTTLYRKVREIKRCSGVDRGQGKSNPRLLSASM